MIQIQQTFKEKKKETKQGINIQHQSPGGGCGEYGRLRIAMTNKDVKIEGTEA